MINVSSVSSCFLPLWRLLLFLLILPYSYLCFKTLLIHRLSASFVLHQYVSRACFTSLLLSSEESLLKFSSSLLFSSPCYPSPPLPFSVPSMLILAKCSHNLGSVCQNDIVTSLAFVFKIQYYEVSVGLPVWSIHMHLPRVFSSPPARFLWSFTTPSLA